MSLIFRYFKPRILGKSYENIRFGRNYSLSIQNSIKEEHFSDLAKDQAFKQVLDDINKALSSASIQDSLYNIEGYEEKPYVRKSPEASFGSKRIGWVMLPDWLNEAVLETIKEHDREIIKQDAKRIYLSLRSTTGYNPNSGIDLKDPIMGPCKSALNTFKRFAQENEVKPHVLEYGNREAIAYLAGYLPISYGPIFNVLTELKSRIPDFSPRNVLDFGTGPGTAIWATHDIWGKSDQNFLGIDTSESMLRTAEKLLSFHSNKDQIKNIEFKRYLTYEPHLKHDLVISAFALNELLNDNVRETVLESLWNKTSDILVLIENGTPAGFKIIAEARKKILRMANKQQMNEVESITDETSDKTNRGAHVVAPCPHDGTCPLIASRNWCHFSQRINRPYYLMKTKNVKKDNFEDSKYSYVILRKGKRPTQITVDVDEKRDLTAEAYYWSRLIMPPMKRSEHVVMDYCYIERGIIPKSQGKTPYRDARKSMWGDLFPHEPKKPAVRRLISQRSKQLDVKSQEKDQMRIPSGQKISKKKDLSLIREGRLRKKERENDVGMASILSL
ncbi:9068_t:CDS:10 [Funneliformis mosseae]|uniref:9068_t:CDS:1 n=1 Tax=Funneliformis mosseae TaxID=27381 RepID=A0A9N9A629_FUNMO|nr:9068_t:CDS:10 [Funneliformis mosseae]